MAVEKDEFLHQIRKSIQCALIDSVNFKFSVILGKPESIEIEAYSSWKRKTVNIEQKIAKIGMECMLVSSWSNDLYNTHINPLHTNLCTRLLVNCVAKM